MHSKEDALRLLFESIPAPDRIETVALADALGRVLAEDVAADLDQPPFDRSAMDGYALRAADLAGAPVELAVTEVIKAGARPERPIGAGQCAKIMTGAPLPAGADAVVMVENSESLGPDRVRILESARSGQNVSLRASDLKEGEVVMAAGSAIRAIEVGMLASCGRDRVRVWKAPSVTVYATGDELVPPGAGRPPEGMIRESNGEMLAAQVRSLGLGIACRFRGIVADSPEAVRSALDCGLEDDVVILSGGVSMGDFDFVHEELDRRGLEVRIRKVSIKPGKPLLFGSLPGADGRRRFVFGLPGNPVSSFVTFELFVRPFLRGLIGRPGPHVLELKARIDQAVPGRAIPRTQHLPARLSERDGVLTADILEWHGSGDLRGLLAANAFVVVPADQPPPRSGDLARILLTEPDPLRLPAPDRRSRP